MDAKDIFLKENNLSESVIKGYNMVFKKVNHLEEKYNKDLKEFNYEELLNVLPNIKSTSYQSINVKWTLLKKYMEYYDNLDYTKITQEDLKKYIEEKTLRYVTREQLLDRIEHSLNNAQDKAIVMLLFEGVMGKAYNDLLNLKVSDIDFENNCINLDNQIIDIHPSTTKILDETRLQKIYEKFGTGSSIGTGDISYELNPKSEYLIKSKPSSRNRGGREPIKVAGIKTRLDKITKSLNMEGLTGLSIYHSGIIEKLIELENEYNKTFTKNDVEEQLKKLNIGRIDPINLFRAMRQLKSQNHIA